MRYALLGVIGGFLFAFATPAAAPASYPQLSLATSSDLSYNWAGYAAQGARYSGVSGRWVVPEVAAGASAQSISADAAWVGIGGVVSTDLIQAGTQAIVDRNGQVSYQAWIETMPDPSVPVDLDLAPGDEVAVSIEQRGPNLWDIAIDNRTSGERYERTVVYRSSLSSAEWIEEMPATLGGGFMPLDSFGAVRFLSATTTVAGQSETAGQADAGALTMINRRGETLADTSVMTAAGGFVVTRSAAEPLPRRSLPRYVPHRGTYR